LYLFGFFYIACFGVNLSKTQEKSAFLVVIKVNYFTKKGVPAFDCLKKTLFSPKKCQKFVQYLSS